MATEKKLPTLSGPDSAFLMDVLALPSTYIQVDVAKIAEAQGKTTKNITNRMSTIRKRYGMTISCANSGKATPDSPVTPKDTSKKERAGPEKSRKRKAESPAEHEVGKEKGTPNDDEDFYEVDENGQKKSSENIEPRKKKPREFKLEPDES